MFDAARSQSRREPLSAALALFAAAFAFNVAHSAPISPFVAASVEVFDGPGNAVAPSQFQSAAAGPVVVATSSPGVVGTSRADFGSNGLDIQVPGGINREVTASSLWSDGMLATGGTGSALFSFQTRIQGTIAGDAALNYALYVSDAPFDFVDLLAALRSNQGGFADLQLPGATRAMYTGVANRCGLQRSIGECASAPFVNFQGALDELLSVDIPVVFNQTFYVLSIFESEVDIFGGAANFFNSADFSILLPEGASLQSLSGANYLRTVSEPPTSSLLLIAIALFVLLQVTARLARRGRHRPVKANVRASVAA